MKHRLHRLRQQDSERGSIMLMVVIFVAAVFLAMLALADSGQKLSVLSSAYDLAGETARYAAGFIDEDTLLAGDPRIDETRAVTEATAFALGAGAETVDVVVAADGYSVTVTLTLSGSESFTPGFDMSTEVTHQAFVLAEPS